jgi:hypothetical protein
MAELVYSVDSFNCEIAGKIEIPKVHLTVEMYCDILREILAKENIPSTCIKVKDLRAYDTTRRDHAIHFKTLDGRYLRVQTLAELGYSVLSSRPRMIEYDISNQKPNHKVSQQVIKRGVRHEEVQRVREYPSMVNLTHHILSEIFAEKGIVRLILEYFVEPFSVADGNIEIIPLMTFNNNRFSFDGLSCQTKPMLNNRELVESKISVEPVCMHINFLEWVAYQASVYIQHNFKFQRRLDELLLSAPFFTSDFQKELEDILSLYALFRKEVNISRVLHITNNDDDISCGRCLKDVDATIFNVCQHCYDEMMSTMGRHETVMQEDRRTFNVQDQHENLHLCQNEYCYDIFKEHKMMYCFSDSCGYTCYEMTTCCDLKMITKKLK